MKRTLTRVPRGAEIGADVLRLVGIASAVAAVIGWGPLEALSVAGAALATLLPRLLGLRPAVDAAFVVVTLVASWSGVLAIYRTMQWWDLPVHFALNALLAAVAYVLLVRLGLLADAENLPRPVLSATIATTSLGIALGVVWEFVEWFVKTFVDEGTLVGYDDTIGDLGAGGLGSIAAGLAMRFIVGDSRAIVEPDEGDRSVARAPAPQRAQR